MPFSGLLVLKGHTKDVWLWCQEQSYSTHLVFFCGPLKSRCNVVAAHFYPWDVFMLGIGQSEYKTLFRPKGTVIVREKYGLCNVCLHLAEYPLLMFHLPQGVGNHPSWTLHVFCELFTSWCCFSFLFHLPLSRTSRNSNIFCNLFTSFEEPLDNFWT